MFTWNQTLWNTGLYVCCFLHQVRHRGLHVAKPTRCHAYIDFTVTRRYSESRGTDYLLFCSPRYTTRTAAFSVAHRRQRLRRSVMDNRELSMEPILFSKWRCVDLAGLINGGLQPAGHS